MVETATEQRRILHLAAWLVMVVLVTLILKSLAFIFIPFSMALLLSYVLGMPYELLGRFRMPDYVRIGIVVLSLLLLLFLSGRLVYANILEFQRQLPELTEKFWKYNGLILERLGADRQDAQDLYNALLVNLQGAGLEPLGNMVKKLGGSFFGFLGNTLWVLLFMVFFLAERASLSNRLLRAFGEEQGPAMLEAGQRINQAVQHYLGLKTLVSAITGLLVWLILFLFGIPFALLWGLLAFVANFIPNIGSIVASLPPIVMALFATGSPGKTLVVGLLIGTVQMTVGNFLEPRLMGRGLNLSPLVVLLSLFFWGWMWGVAGMLLAVPLTAAIKIGMEQADCTRPVSVLLSGR